MKLHHAFTAAAILAAAMPLSAVAIAGPDIVVVDEPEAVAQEVPISTLAPGQEAGRGGTPPTVSSIIRSLAETTNSDVVGFRVAFTQAVTGVDESDFQVSVGGGLTTATLLRVTGHQHFWSVQVAAGPGEGTLQLHLLDDDSIINGTGVPLGGPGAGNGSVAGPAYTILRTTPEIQVTTGEDEEDGDTWSLAALEAFPGGTGISLREAVLAANATEGPVRITFADPLVPATLTLGSVIFIDGDLEIDGGAVRPLIDGGGATRLFSVVPGRNVALRRLELANGFMEQTAAGEARGAAVNSPGRLTIDDCIIRDCVALGSGMANSSVGGAIFSDGDLIVRDSHFANNMARTASDLGFMTSYGGAIANTQASLYDPSLTIERSHFTGNTSRIDGVGQAFGGAVSWHRNGWAEIRDSTLDGNRVIANGPPRSGSTNLLAYGGAMILSNLTGGVIVNTTLHDNNCHAVGHPLDGGTYVLQLVGGGIFRGGAGGINYDMLHCTLTENTLTFGTGGGTGTINLFSQGGGVGLEWGTMRVGHALTSGNDAVGGGQGDLYSWAGFASYTNLGHNEYSVPGGHLLPLADNGGPVPTRAPAPGSSAFNAGDPLAEAGVGSVPLHDARGLSRVAGGRIDIGAYESQAGLRGAVWIDANRNGRRDMGEQGVPGATLRVLDAMTFAEAASTATGTSGTYILEVAPGEYVVEFDPIPNHEFTMPNVGDDIGDSDVEFEAAGQPSRTAPFTISDGEFVSDVDAGFVTIATDKGFWMVF